MEADGWDQLPADLSDLLALLPQADLYLQDEVQVACYPTLTRVGSRRGRRGPRRVAAPSSNEKVYGVGLVDWRAGCSTGAAAHSARPTCSASNCARQSRARHRRQPATLTAAGPRLVREVAAAAQEHRILVYAPAYDPDAHRSAWLWRILRAAVTHNHQRATFALLLADLQTEFDRFRQNSEAVLAHMGSPGSTSPTAPELVNAAYTKATAGSADAVR